MTGFEIRSIENARDGRRAIVSLNGTPSGTLRFRVARTPALADAIEATHAGTGPFVLDCGYAAGWFVWAGDDDGWTAPGAVWVGVTDSSDVEEVGACLRDILIENKALLDAAIALFGRRLTVAQIVFGQGALVDDWPAIVIDEPRFGGDFIATNRLAEENYSVDISAVIMHADAQTALPVTCALARAAMRVLNLRDEIALPSGRALALCRVRDGSATEREVPGFGWCGEASLRWSGKGLSQDTP